MTSSPIDSIAKQIYDSTYTHGAKFIYVLNGYRIIGEIVNYIPSNISATQMSIHIRKIVNDNMKILKIKADHGNEVKLELIDGKETICIPPVARESMIGQYNTVFGYMKLFEFISARLPPVNDVKCITRVGNNRQLQYFGYTIVVDPTTADFCEPIVTKIVSLDGTKQYDVELSVGEYRAKLNNGKLHISLTSGSELHRYEQLFVWIKNQMIIEKISVMEEARDEIDKLGVEIIDDKRAIVSLEKQIDELTKQVATRRDVMSSKQKTMSTYSKLLEYAN